jgi:hypothetical protein
METICTSRRYAAAHRGSTTTTAKSEQVFVIGKRFREYLVEDGYERVTTLL